MLLKLNVSLLVYVKWDFAKLEMEGAGGDRERERESYTEVTLLQ